MEILIDYLFVLNFIVKSVLSEHQAHRPLIH